MLSFADACFNFEPCFDKPAFCAGSFRKFLVIMAALFVAALASRAYADKPVSFNEQIRPLLNVQCSKCHGGVKEAGNLHLLFRDSALKGGKSGRPRQRSSGRRQH